MIFNEDARVKIPAVMHLTRLGYTYLSLKDAVWDLETNIFTKIFKTQIAKINPGLTDGEIDRIYIDVALSLENEDLGKAFYQKLIQRSGNRLIDFENFGENSFHVVTELPCKKDDEEFRPDITLLINGMPLAFIEVKRPNNTDGMLAEQKRMQTRFQNKKFRNFANITQLMVFSNNMPYNEHATSILEGAFYAAASYQKHIFNYFREEEIFDLSALLKTPNEADENEVLKDNNVLSIKTSAEFNTNKNPNSPTHKILTSLFQKDRLAFMLQYSLAYVKTRKGLQKHVMRYPQIFAAKAIVQTLDKGIKKGIIWHTQGSGKTALAYYCVKYLTDYFQKKGIVPKFYFIVDRIDLLDQAAIEFRSRDLHVHEIDSREDFARDIKSSSVIHNASGKAEITAVNIQRFENDPDVIQNLDYDLGIQRIFFLDEVHRSYNPTGSFLANLTEADKQAIKIGLTGTPLLGTDYNSKMLFGGYIHKYYYNASIKDGYTLRLIREEIETNYRLMLQKALEEIAILKGNIDRKKIYAHPTFVEPMLTYIVSDFENSRIASGDPTIGAMVICDSADQAKMMYEIFQQKYAIKETVYEEMNPMSQAAEEMIYKIERQANIKVRTASLILHDVSTKKDRKDDVEKFKAGEIDILFVYNMLLTGFDAPRLKKLYLGRIIKAHNLLQALTRVNRTYNWFQYGYVVDFANIEKEFDKTNRAYFDELQAELGDELEHYNNLFKPAAEIELEIAEIKEILFQFDTLNAEIFSQQISQISDRATMLQITKALNNARALYNVIRQSGNYELLDRLDFKKLNLMAGDANKHLAMINAREALENNVDNTNLLNIALEDVIFTFVKINEAELVLADELKSILQRTREMLGGNFDPRDPEFVSLKEELERLFRKKNLNDVTKKDMEQNIVALNAIYAEAKELERKNQLLRAKYASDAKYARLHKRLMEKDPLTDKDSKLFEALQGLKTAIDEQILNNAKLLDNESFTEKMMLRLVVEQFNEKHHFNLSLTNAHRINSLVVKEYLDEFHGRVA